MNGNHGRGGEKRRQVNRATMIGLGVTVVVAILQLVGALSVLDGYLLDLRMAHAHFFSPEISDEIVHVDIDTSSTDEIGRFPWDREVLARAIDSLSELGARTIVLDILFHDPQRLRIVRTSEGEYREIHDDNILGESIARAGNVIVGAWLSDIEEESVAWPVPEIREAVVGLGFVEPVEKRGVIRSVETVKEVKGSRLLQMGLAGATHYLGLDLADVTIEKRELRVGDYRMPVKGSRALIPWRTRSPRDADWIKGKSKAWERIHRRAPISAFIRYPQIRDEMRTALGLILRGGARYEGEINESAFAEAEETVEFILESSFPGKSLEEALAEAERQHDQEQTSDSLDILNFVAAADALVRGRRRIEELREVVADKLIFVGWTSTASASDFYPTAVGVKTAGVSVHAAIANGILTGHWITQTPAWLGVLLTLAAGVSATFVATRQALSWGWIAALGLSLGYSVLNVMVFFDLLGYAVALAGPVIAAIGSWSACTTVRAIQEQREKAAVRRQFRSRVSSQLVDFLTENPDLINMDGEEREMTMIFTDFVGFTSISEKLEGKQTVAILNRYLRQMTDVLLDHNAYVNKFMGDGIMAFWNAPALDPEHAVQACAATMDCYSSLDMLNKDPKYKDLPKLGMRIGVSTGTVIVGDCGAPPRLNDYTVIGDAVNLAARLESANKLLGTQALITARTLEVMGEEGRERFLWRRFGKLRVVGQTIPTEIFELIGFAADATITDETKQWIADTEVALRLFEGGEIEAAMEKWQDLVLFERGQAGALAYVERCAELLESGSNDYVLPLRSK